jgi:predicted acylesterase/phospholipase RssA
MPAPPFKIQLALQGGGAKIYGLLAAMHAVEALQTKGILQVTRVAGTSAGAIVGALFAAGIPMVELTNALLGDSGKRLVKSFRFPNKLVLGSNIVFGTPFWKTDLLEKIIDSFLSPLKIRKFSDIKRKTGIDVVVMAADLGESGSVRCEGNHSVVQSLMNSAGLPFCFRTWSAKGAAPVHVDGGICENLPIGELKREEATEGKIVAFTFPFVRPGAPSDLKTFAMALLDTAINNSMNRAKSALNETSIFEIPTNLGTFEFERAIREGKGAEFELIQLKTDKFLQDLVATAEDQKEIIQDNPWTETNRTAVRIIESIGRVYNAQHANSKFKYITCRFAVTVKAMLPDTDLHYSEPDIITYSSTFRPLDEAIYCLTTAISQPPKLKDYLGRTNWELRDERNQLVKSTPIPSRNPNKPTDWEIIHFLDPVIQPNDGVFKLKFYDEAYNFMEPLVTSRQDELVFFPRRAAGSVDRLELILNIPLTSPGVKMVAKDGPQSGRKMKEEELTDTPPGYYSVGWVGENVDAVPSFGVDIYR